MLQEARAAISCDYVELWNSRAEERVAHTGDEPRALGILQFADQPVCGDQTMFVLEPGEDARVQAALRDAGRAAVLARRFEAARHEYALFFAWNQRRPRTLGDSEVQYVDFLTHVLSRVLVLADKYRELNDRVSIDPLTGLQNRAATLDRIALAVSSAKRNPNQFAVLYVDLNGFKQVNDSHGHTLGDRALAEAARRMRAVLRRHEMAGRIGGDEFAVLVDFDDVSDLERVAERLLEAICEPIEMGTTRLALSASVGIAIFPQHGTTAEDLLAHADSAMYSAKRGSGAQYAFYDSRVMTRTPAQPAAPPRPAAEAPAPLAEPAVAPAAAAAPDSPPFVFCFQPIVDARTSRIVAAEALIRWFDPVRGLVLPGALNESGALPKNIDRIVAETLGTGEYRQTSRIVPIHVNISEADETLLASLPADAGIALEIPEALVAEDGDRCLEFMQQARKRGLRAGLSDFGGSGLPLRFVASLPIDFVKIANMPAAAARAAIQQAHHFGWTVIAENVEDETQRDWLVSAGVDALQGYQICSPLTHNDFANWLKYRMAK